MSTDFHSVLAKAQAAQRAVDELGAGRRDEALCVVKRRQLFEALQLLDQSVKFGEAGDARMFDTTRQARALLQRVLEAPRAIDELGAGAPDKTAAPRRVVPIERPPGPPKCDCEDWCGECDLCTAPPGIGLS